MEKNIHKFISHVVNNLSPLNEYQEGEIKSLMAKFKQDADDLNFEITDAELRKYIEDFDQLKNSFKVEDKNLRNWDFPKFIKLVTRAKGREIKKETGPDVIYSGDGITVYSGGNEELCQRHRNEVPWCITKNSFGNYRYVESRKFPSFYLIKNDTEEYRDDEKLAFVAIQVRNTTDESEKYIWTPKDNDPNESKPMSWSQLTSDIPWLDSIPGVKDMLKNISLSPEEKGNFVFSKKAISIRQWISLPFAAKKIYLIVRKDESDLFNDISKDEFTANYLPNYPQLATFIATTAGIIPSNLLLKNLGKFKDNDRKSIIANLHTYIDTNELSKETIPFDVKKLLVTLKKWQIGSDERMYITKNGEAIVKLKFTSGDVQVGVFTAEDDYPNIKLNARTSKYLLDYPDIDKIPFNTLIKLTNDNIVDKSFIENVIVKAEEDPNSSIVVKDVEDGKILLDSNSFTSYKIKDGKISSIPFDSEEVQSVLSSENENKGFQESAVNLVFEDKNLPSDIDKNSFINILNNTPYSQRLGTARNVSAVILVNPQAEVDSGNKLIFTIPRSIDRIPFSSITDYGRYGEWTRYDYTNSLGLQDWAKIIQYYKDTDQKFTDNKLKELLSSRSTDTLAKSLVQMDLPMAEDSTLKPVMVGNRVLLVNANDPRSSFIVSDKSGKMLNKVLTPAQVRQILGGAAPAVPATTPRTPQTPTQAAPAAEPNAAVDNRIDNAGLVTGFNSLPTNIKGRIRGGTPTPYTRRNAAVDAIGTVQTLIQNGQSKFYIIQLPSGTVIGFATMQPDARHYIVTTTTAYQVPRVGQLASVLQQRNISEGTKTMLKVHAAAYPGEANEIKKILQKLKIK